MHGIADHIDGFVADLKRRNFRPNTVRAYAADLRTIAHHLTTPLDQITLTAVEVVFDALATAPATAARRGASLNRFFIWAKKQSLCTSNPLADREPVRRVTRRLPRPVRSTTDLVLLDQAIGATAQPYRLIFTILRETGMRISEVLVLQRADVSLEPGREGLRIREPKNGAERIAPLGAKATPKSLRGLRTWLKEFKGQPGYVPLFRSNRGTAVSYAAAQYQWTKLCTAAGLIDGVAGQHHLRYTMHQLRHTRGSELTHQGQPLEIVQRVLGHRDIRSTQGYAELDDLQVRTALEQPPRHQ